MNDADLLKPYLDQLAEKLTWSPTKKPLRLKGLRLTLRQILISEGMASMLVPPSLEPTITTYFDQHEGFERVSEEPEWRPRVKRHRASHS